MIRSPRNKTPRARPTGKNSRVRRSPGNRPAWTKGVRMRATRTHENRNIAEKQADKDQAD